MCQISTVSNAVSFHVIASINSQLIQPFGEKTTTLQTPASLPADGQGQGARHPARGAILG